MSETINITKVATLGEAATGSIDPETRTDILIEKVNELSDRLDAGEFLVPTDKVIPCGCVDGRLCAHGGRNIVPNAAGGTLTLVVADALTFKTFQGADVAKHMTSVATFIKDKNDPRYVNGVHGDTHADTEGCGANKKLALVLQKIIDSADDIRKFLDSKGVRVSDDLHGLIAGRTAGLIESGYAATAGTPVIEAAKGVGGEGIYEAYDGDHNEVKLNLNLEYGTTIDRAAIREEYGDEYQAFNVDVWALEEAAKLMSENDSDESAVYARLVASLYYNAATALTLAGPGLRV